MTFFKKFIKKINNKIKKIYVKNSFAYSKKINNEKFTRDKQLLDFKKFTKKFVYKDENWNYINNLHEYLNSIYNKKIKKYHDNEIKNVKYKLTNDILKVSTAKINNNWLCFALKELNIKRYEINYDIIINSEFEEIQIAFKYKNLGTRYRFMISNNEHAVFECVHKGRFYNKLAIEPFKLELGKKYNIKLIIYDNKYYYYINNKLIFSIKEKRQLSNGNDIMLIFYNYDDSRKIEFELQNLELYSLN